MGDLGTSLRESAQIASSRVEIPNELFLVMRASEASLSVYRAVTGLVAGAQVTVSLSSVPHWFMTLCFQSFRSFVMFVLR